MNCAYLTRFKFWATSITFPRTCSIFDSSNNCDPNKYDVQHPPGCSLYSNHHKSRGSVQKRNHTSQPVVVSFMFYQVNDFGIVFHVASKDYSRRHNLLLSTYTSVSPGILQTFSVLLYRMVLLLHLPLDATLLPTVLESVSLCGDYRTTYLDRHQHILSWWRWHVHCKVHHCFLILIIQSFFLCIISNGSLPGCLLAGPFPPFSGYVMNVWVALKPIAGFIFCAPFIFRASDANIVWTNSLRFRNSFTGILYLAFV